MLDLPQLLYFKNKNLYSACQAEMRYRAVPGKRKGEDGTEEAVLTVDIWPGPWTIEYTDPALRLQQVFALTEEGLGQARAWLKTTYEQDPDRWQAAPSILDCEPWTPPARPEEENL
ncbi:MAG TPA: hypothetical protein H9996_08680 [Candidatus Faecalibacterium avium]|uniref:hypothetical protein n=1 Tax=unclassified Faecalibacterium TaxID=2646395 RepID=UPI000B384B49|nr:MULTISPECIES: hypothetical protein [unclassified Faecalibacterium]OUN75915.1 hypothetical protein B5G12_02325 [Faecalibacterium sp. An58]OUQ38321.1 hypothetical protein B5E66_06765 [Faecalibacterium sp. An121]HIV44255.1 hypothetical protein [Candidatus Faecalibacterium avium]